MLSYARREFVARIAKRGPGLIYHDGASGDGATARALVQNHGFLVLASDSDMRCKMNVEGIKWHHASLQKLPFLSESIDVYSISFGLMYCGDTDQLKIKALEEAHRVLRPSVSDASLFLLEYGLPDDEEMRAMMMKNTPPPMSQQNVIKYLQNAQFGDITCTAFSEGMLCMYEAKKLM